MRKETCGFVCPVCDYADPGAPPFGDAWYQEICPGCGTQFGYDDATRTHDDLRNTKVDKV